MLTHWRTLNVLEDLGDKWDSMSEKPGIYIIKRKKSVRRVADVDPNGILYIGKSLKLRDRLWQFRYGNHTASGFLWDNLKIAARIFGSKCKSEDDIKESLGGLKVKYATPIDPKKLEQAERAVLYAYVYWYGEAPPLNLSLAKRWESPPQSDCLRWARRGLS